MLYGEMYKVSVASYYIRSTLHLYSVKAKDLVSFFYSQKNEKYCKDIKPSCCLHRLRTFKITFPTEINLYVFDI